MRREPAIEHQGDSFILLEDGVRTGPFAFADLIPLGRQGSSVRYGLAGLDGWRLGLDGPIPEEIATRLPADREYGRWIDRWGIKSAVLGFALVSAAAIWIALQLPQWVAPLVPYSWERKIGTAMVGDFGGRFCTTPKGTAALQALTRELDAQPEDLNVQVANVDIVNAVALPGGNIILFDGMVDAAQSPDELAGVLAHEMGHVRRRHVMQSLLRQLGLSVLLSGANGNVGGALNTVLALSYGREAEREADLYSVDAMRDADISPKDTAGFFARMARAEKQMGADNGNSILGYMSSHPLSAERRDTFLNSRVEGKAYRSALTPDQWKALKSMCRDDKSVKGDGSLF